MLALQNELTKLGADISVTNNSLSLEKSKAINKEVCIETYKDHRMAMAGAVIGLAVSDVVIEDIATTSKTLPDFASMWHDMVKT